MFTVVAKRFGQIKVIGVQDNYASSQYVAFYTIMYNNDVCNGSEILIFKNGKLYQFYDIK